MEEKLGLRRERGGFAALAANIRKARVQEERWNPEIARAHAQPPQRKRKGRPSLKERERCYAHSKHALSKSYPCWGLEGVLRGINC